MRGSFLGPSYSDTEIERVLHQLEAPYTRLSDEALFARVAEELAAEKVVGWFQGRMEFGPQSVMNRKIKYRESFRPFAPSVLRERVAEYFALETDSPYMLLVAPVREARRTVVSEAQQRLWGIERLHVPRSDIPAVTHVDYSARVQTVHPETNPRYYRLLKAFEAKTGCGVLVNTSFNVRGEPIVCAPEEAYRCFMRTEIDVLVVGNCVLDKLAQKPWVHDSEWRAEEVLVAPNYCGIVFLWYPHCLNAGVGCGSLYLHAVLVRMRAAKCQPHSGSLPEARHGERKSTIPLKNWNCF
jgi:carbamoyltransferase